MSTPKGVHVILPADSGRAAEAECRVDTLNTRLFGNPEGDAGDEGRLVVLERRMNNHSGRISRLEGFS